MNLRLVQFSSQDRSAAEALAKEIVPAIKEQPGCKSCYFFADHDAGNYGIAVVWETAENAHAAAAAMSPILMKGIEAAKATGLTRGLFEIYEP